MGVGSVRGGQSHCRVSILIPQHSAGVKKTDHNQAKEAREGQKKGEGSLICAFHSMWSEVISGETKMAWLALWRLLLATCSELMSCTKTFFFWEAWAS